MHLINSSVLWKVDFNVNMAQGFIYTRYNVSQLYWINKQQQPHIPGVIVVVFKHPSKKM